MAAISRFKQLPLPAVLEAIDIEAILAATMADVAARLQAAGIDYDVDALETDTVKILEEAAALREARMRARVNDGIRSNLLPFSSSSDLDHLAAFHDVERLEGESDEALRERVALAVSGRSTAGPADWYRSAARRASIRVKDAAIYRPGAGPDLRIAVLAADNFGEPDAELLDAVREVVTADDVRVVSDRIEVVAATSASVDVEADVWLQPDTPQTVFDNLEASLRSALADQGGLGFDVTRSWLTAMLHQAGVHKVVLSAPEGDIRVTDNQAAKFGTILLTYRGRDR